MGKLVNRTLVCQVVLVAEMLFCNLTAFMFMCCNVGYEDAGKGLALNPIMEKFNSLMIAGKKDSVEVIEYHLLEAATNGFGESNVLAEGGRGCVYKACFDEKFFAAVKRIEGGGQDAQREFEVSNSCSGDNAVCILMDSFNSLVLSTE